MANHIICPNCKIAISDHPMIDAAEKGVGLGTQSFNCENCGERITYWAITAQLREQKTIGWRFKNWVWSFSQERGNDKDRFDGSMRGFETRDDDGQRESMRYLKTIPGKSIT